METQGLQMEQNNKSIREQILQISFNLYFEYKQGRVC